MFSHAFGVPSKGMPSEYLILEMQYNGTYNLEPPAYAGYLGSFNEGIEIILHEAH